MASVGGADHANPFWSLIQCDPDTVEQQIQSATDRAFRRSRVANGKRVAVVGDMNESVAKQPHLTARSKTSRRNGTVADEPRQKVRQANSRLKDAITDHTKVQQERNRLHNTAADEAKVLQAKSHQKEPIAGDKKVVQAKTHPNDKIADGTKVPQAKTRQRETITGGAVFERKTRQKEKVADGMKVPQTRTRQKDNDADDTTGDLMAVVALQKKGQIAGTFDLIDQSSRSVETAAIDSDLQESSSNVNVDHQADETLIAPVSGSLAAKSLTSFPDPHDDITPTSDPGSEEKRATGLDPRDDGPPESGSTMEGNPVTTLPTEAAVRLVWRRALPTRTAAVYLRGTFAKEPIPLKIKEGTDVYESDEITLKCGSYRCRLHVNPRDYNLETIDIKHYTFEVDLYIEDEEPSPADPKVKASPDPSQSQACSTAAQTTMDDVIEGGTPSMEPQTIHRGQLFESILRQQVTNGYPDKSGHPRSPEVMRRSPAHQSEVYTSNARCRSVDRINEGPTPRPGPSHRHGDEGDSWRAGCPGTLGGTASINDEETPLGPYLDRSLDRRSDPGGRRSHSVDPPSGSDRHERSSGQDFMDPLGDGDRRDSGIHGDQDSSLHRVGRSGEPGSMDGRSRQRDPYVLRHEAPSCHGDDRGSVAPSRPADPRRGPAIRSALVTTRTIPVSAARTHSGSRNLAPFIASSGEEMDARLSDLGDTVATLRRSLADRDKEVEEQRISSNAMLAELSKLRKIYNTPTEGRDENEKRLNALIQEKESLATEVWKLRQGARDSKETGQEPPEVNAVAMEIGDGAGDSRLDTYDPNNPRALQRKMDDLAGQLQDLTEAHEATVGRLAESERLGGQLRAENATLRGERVSTLREDRSTAQLLQENRTLKAQLERLHVDGYHSDQPQSEVLQLRHEVQQLRQELRSLSDRNQQLMQDNIKLTRHLQGFDHLPRGSTPPGPPPGDRNRTTGGDRVNPKHLDTVAADGFGRDTILGDDEEVFARDRLRITRELKQLITPPRWRSNDGRQTVAASAPGSVPYDARASSNGRRPGSPIELPPPEDAPDRSRSLRERPPVANGYHRDLTPPPPLERRLSDESVATVDLMRASPLGELERQRESGAGYRGDTRPIPLMGRRRLDFDEPGPRDDVTHASTSSADGRNSPQSGTPPRGRAHFGNFRSVSTKPIVTQHNKHVVTTSSPDPISSAANKRPFAPRSPADVNIGDVVKFCRHGGKISRGVVKYVGHLAGKNDTYLGLELDHEMGKHDGVYDGQRYFQCKHNRGVCVAFSKIVMVWGD